MNSYNKMTLHILSKSVNESYARVCVAAFAAQLDPTLDELMDIKTAVSEAVTNCIVHAYRNTIGVIVIRTEIFESGRVVISVKDSGSGIENIKQAMEPCFTTSPGEERSGMGFSIMKSLMDSLRVYSKPGKGTRVVMSKYIASKKTV